MGLLSRWIEGYSFGKGAGKGAKFAIVAVTGFLASHQWAADLVASVAAQLQARGYDVSAGQVEVFVGGIIAGILGFLINFAKTNTRWGKVLLALPVLVALSAPARAVDLERVRFDVGPLTLQLPLAQASVVHLYDVVNAKPLVGAETPVAHLKGVMASVGAVTTLDGLGTPFLGFGADIPEKVFGERVAVGLWLGRDYRANTNRAGLKASIELW